MDMNPTNLNGGDDAPTQPWYLNISMDTLKDAYPSPAFTPASYKEDPLVEMQSEKIDQSDRLLNHTAKAILTRTTLERAQARQRSEEAQVIGNHLVQFDEEPFGMNQLRDKMRWSLEQNLMALSREDRTAQLAFWNDLWTLSRELLTCLNEHEKWSRRWRLWDPKPGLPYEGAELPNARRATPPAYEIPPRIP